MINNLLPSAISRFLPQDILYIQLARKKISFQLFDRNGMTLGPALERHPGELLLHPRTLLDDFMATAAFIDQSLRDIPLRRWRSQTIFLWHLLEMTEGGITKIEERALAELASHLGAIKSHIWEGSPPDTEQIAAFSY